MQHRATVRKAKLRYNFTSGCLISGFLGPSGLLCLPDLLNIFLQRQFSLSLPTSQPDAADGADGGASGAAAGTSVYMESAIKQTLAGFGQIAEFVQHVAKLGGAATRVSQFIDVVDSMEQRRTEGKAHTQSSTAVLEMKNVDLVTPTGVCLAEKLNVCVAKGDSIMITGPNSAGKSSFFRLLAGLWPTYNLDGIVERPAKDQLLLVPQRAYSVTGSIPDQVTYPKILKARTEQDENAIRAAMEAVGLAYLLDREGWDKIKKWEDFLSLGEQQRMGLARVFYHKPAFAVLDECTDAVSAEVEEKLYTPLKEMGISRITISKRLALEDFHDRELALGLPTQAGWEIREISHHSEEQETPAQPQQEQEQEEQEEVGKEAPQEEAQEEEKAHEEREEAQQEQAEEQEQEESEQEKAPEPQPEAEPEAELLAEAEAEVEVEAEAEAKPAAAIVEPAPELDSEPMPQLEAEPEPEPEPEPANKPQVLAKKGKRKKRSKRKKKAPKH